MMTNFEIKYFEKFNSNGIYEIDHKIGGTNFDGSLWEISIEKAIDAIELGEWNFYVQDGANKTEVIVATTVEGLKYLKTKTDIGDANTLSLLPEFKR